MKTICAGTLCALLVFTFACGTRVNDAADVQAIKDLSAEFDTAENAGDASWYTTSYYLENAVRMPPNEPAIIGKEAIGKSIAASYAEMGNIHQESAPEEVLTSGNLAVARGKYTWSGTPKAGGLGTWSEQGKWMAAYQKQPDGSWRCLIETWTSDQPAPGATPNRIEEKALYQLERDWVAADLTRDTSVVEKFLADDFVSNYKGRTTNKSQFLAEMKRGRAKIESAENSEMKASVFGDTGFVQGLYSEKSTTDGKDTSQKIRYNEVYVKRDGQWQCVTQYLVDVK